MQDVVIVGGSVAGAGAAVELARAGREVLLIERTTTHRRKACGEGIFPAGVRALADLGVLDELRPQAAELRTLRFIAGRHVATAPLGRGAAHGLGVQRSVLDPAMLAAAERAGACVRRGVTARGLVRGAHGVAVRTDEGVLDARMIIAADGLRSRLRREAGLARAALGGRYGISAHVRVPRGAGDGVRVYIERGRELYVTPVGGDAANVALLMDRGQMRGFAGDTAAAFRAALASVATLSGAELLDEPAAAGPFPAGCTRAWRGNLVLAGDAAGFFDGISGEGISAALLGARACARAVDAYLHTGDRTALRRYDNERRALTRNSDLLARLSLALAARPALARWSVRNLARRPDAFARLVAINTGDLPLRALRPRDLVALTLGV